VVDHALYVAFRIAEVAISKKLFVDMLWMGAGLRPPPTASTT
jgi:hypothetical protein